jgi:hypothetical protein
LRTTASIPSLGSTSSSRGTGSAITSISMTAQPYCSCFSRIKPCSLLSSGGTSTLRRSFAQKTTGYLQLDPMVRSRCNSLDTL